MIIPLNMQAPYQELKQRLDQAYFRVMQSGHYIMGPELKAFEQEYARYCDSQHCIGVGNGLEALQLMLMALDIGPGDEVIVPSNTYIATWLAVSHVGATVVPVEPDIETFNLDPSLVERAITPRTKAILAVHLYGRAAPVDVLNQIIKWRPDIKVLEDNAQAQGAILPAYGQTTGSLGFAAGHSFYPGKNLGGFGDGGAITTNNDEFAARVRKLRNYGSKLKYVNDEKGLNSRLDELQAAFLRVRLEKLSEWNSRRIYLAHQYSQAFEDVPNLIIPEASWQSSNVWHQYVVRTEYRNELQDHLLYNEISTLIHYPIPPHLSDAYKQEFGVRGQFPIAEELANTVLSLPIGPHQTMTQTQRIVDVVKSFDKFVVNSKS
jgi:dTDP-4-amino-4,6-dideoxygalactose transaminase